MVFCGPVALRKESVDRNFLPPYAQQLAAWSLSARRAWIEIYLQFHLFQPCPSLSARRAWIEISIQRAQFSAMWSLSERRAWIEMICPQAFCACFPSLSARRAWIEIARQCRKALDILESLSARRAWIEITPVALSVNPTARRSPQGERG